MAHAMFAGSFDPLTNGHAEIIKEASHIFTKIDVVVANNCRKKYMFLLDERFQMVKKYVDDLYREGYTNLRAEAWSGLIVDYTKRHNSIKYLIRGIRNTKDYENEQEMAIILREAASLRTIWFPANTSIKNLITSSSLVRELIEYGSYEFERFVPRIVRNIIVDSTQAGLKFLS
jgi:pantetheine-phosphate adenylyltransferase